MSEWEGEGLVDPEVLDMICSSEGAFIYFSTYWLSNVIPPFSVAKLQDPVIRHLSGVSQMPGTLLRRSHKSFDNKPEVAIIFVLQKVKFSHKK